MAADCGWITGHTYVAYGPTLLGGTQVRAVILYSAKPIKTT
jgi:acyl-coenzyme A synthetase/AMP-(fatty) acid ligase